MTIRELWYYSNMHPNTNINIYTYNRKKVIYTGKFKEMPTELFEKKVYMFVAMEVKDTFITDMEIMLEYREENER